MSGKEQACHQELEQAGIEEDVLLLCPLHSGVSQPSQFSCCADPDHTIIFIALYNCKYLCFPDLR